MGKKVLNKSIAVIIAGAVCFGGTNVFASTKNSSRNMAESSGFVSPCFIAIISCLNNLTINYGGRLTCEGITEVQDGYIAGVTIELQQNNGDWNTIETWNGSDYDYIYLSRDWYVESGYSYRLKLTHTALNADNVVIDSYICYSKMVTY